MGEELLAYFPIMAAKKILARFDSIDTQLGSISIRMDSFDIRLVSLEEKVDRRVMETRPIWEQVLKRLDGVDIRFDGIETCLSGVDTRLDGIETRLNGVETRLNGVETRLEGVERKLEAVENRLGKVEHELYALGKKFRVFNQEILDVQNAQEDFEERVTKLETTPTN